MAQIDACKEKISFLKFLLKLFVLSFFAYILVYFNIDEPIMGQKIIFAVILVINVVLIAVINQKLLKEIRRLGEL